MKDGYWLVAALIIFIFGMWAGYVVTESAISDQCQKIGDVIIKDVVFTCESKHAIHD